MKDKYIIVNKKDRYNPLRLMDTNNNSGILCFDTEKEAATFLERKYNSIDFCIMAEEDWTNTMQRIVQCKLPKDLVEFTNEVSFSSREKRDTNINGFVLPILVANNEEYISRLEERLNAFQQEIAAKPCFKEVGLDGEVNKNCNLICLALAELMAGDEELGDAWVAELLKGYEGNKFVISCLDESYAFRGLSPYELLHSPNIEPEHYDEMCKYDLSFYRARVVEKEVSLSEIVDIISLPFSKRSLSGNLRFSAQGEICLYLGVTSYVCAHECQWDDNDETKALYVSAFKCNDKGKKLKILNLAISEPLINGIRHFNTSYHEILQHEMIKVFPLVIATSFTVDHGDENRQKIEYLLSQSIIRVMKQSGVDGVAYLSRRGEDDFQYPIGVNLAIPMNDVCEGKEYSDLYGCFTCTKPVSLLGINMDSNANKRSYINQFYPNTKILYKGENVLYKNNCFSKLDDYLINQDFCEFMRLVQQ